MGEGTLIDYQLRLFGKRIDWQTRITRFNPPHAFVDVQLKGPYSLWHHVHTFESQGHDTVMVDRVDYDIPFGPLGQAAHALMVRRTLNRIFDYRAHSVDRLLGG